MRCGVDYDFDQAQSRAGSFSAKYDERYQKFGMADVIPLWVADMDFRVAPAIVEALSKRAEQGIFGYTSRPASYNEAFVDWQRERHGWYVDPALVSFCPGVVPALAALIRLHSSVGEGILIQPPVYPEFADMIAAAGRVVIENRLVERDGVYDIDFDNLEACLRRGPRLFILCNPHNPVGRVWRKEELERMAALCAAYEVPVVSDEIHADLALWGNIHTVMASVSETAARITTTCTANSKTFNLAGLQAAFTVCPSPEEKAAFDGYWKGQGIHRNNCFSLVAVEAAYRHGADWLEALKRYLQENIQYVVDYCAARLPGIRALVPESTYLIWLDCRGLGLTGEALPDFMVRKAGLGLSDGRSFARGLEGFMRLNAACPRVVLRAAMDRLRRAIEELAESR